MSLMIRPRLLAVTSLAAVALTGCAAFSDTARDDGGGEGAPTVLASFYPLEYLAAEIGGDRVEVGSITPPGADPHNVELAPRTVAELEEAALVLYVSGFQPAVDEAVDVTGARAFDAGEHTALLTTAQTGHDHADHDHDHADDQDHPHEDDHADGAPLDPHSWLDPARLAEVADALADELAELDPDGATTYRENADRVVATLEELDAEITAGLARCERRTIVVAHEAYGYLTTKHGLHQEGLSGIDPDAEPSPARLAEIADVVAEHDVDTVFVESLLSPAVSEALAADLGLRTAVLDALENQQDASADYVDVMRANLGALQAALRCEPA